MEHTSCLRSISTSTHVFGVGRDGEQLGVQRFELGERSVERQDLGRADEGELHEGVDPGQSDAGPPISSEVKETHVHGVKEEDEPLALVVGEADVL